MSEHDSASLRLKQILEKIDDQLSTLNDDMD